MKKKEGVKKMEKRKKREEGPKMKKKTKDIKGQQMIPDRTS